MRISAGNTYPLATTPAGGSGGTIYGYNSADSSIGTASSYGYFHPWGDCKHSGWGIGAAGGIGGGLVWSNADDWHELEGDFSTTLIAAGPVSIEIDHGSNGVWVVQVSPPLMGVGEGYGFVRYNTYTPPDSVVTLDELGYKMGENVDKLYGGGYCGCH